MSSRLHRSAPPHLRPRLSLLFALALSGTCIECRRAPAETKRSSEQSKQTGPRKATPFEVAEIVYDGGLRPGWQDWGWGKHDLASGVAKIDLSNFGGFIIAKPGLGGPFGALVFRMHAPQSFGDFLQVKLAYGNDQTSLPTVNVGPGDVLPLPDGWKEILIPWSDLNPGQAPFDRIILHAYRSVGAEMVQFDKIFLTKLDERMAAQALASAPTRPAELAIDCRKPGQPISRYIYGIAAAGQGEPWELGATARRWGGNPTSRYNWEHGTAFNVARDWYFENVQAPDYKNFLTENEGKKVVSAITIPIMGWVAKDTVSHGFPVSVFGPQQATDPYRNDAGNGLRPDGTPLPPRAPTQTSIPAPPEMMARWVADIRTRDAKDGDRSVKMYILDNEPTLWSATHRDVHPEPLGYDELLDRTIRYGTAVRQAAPDTLIAGPAEWGWTGYFYSAKDTAAGVALRPDRRAHGDVPLLPWYLKKLHEHEKATGVKLLDVVDVHFYPQAAGVYGDAGLDPKTQALRLRSTRALWDPHYKDESWIDDNVRLIPRLREWIGQNYPGLQISIGEYNLGGERHMSGALALAEALGRFGTEGVSYAFYWAFPPKDSPAFWAFRAYTNFDGAGGRFLDHSVPTRMAPDVSLFASRDESKKRIVAIALNLDPTRSAKARISLDGCGPLVSRRRFVYGPHTPAIKADGVVPDAKIEETLPPYSMTILDLKLE